MDYSLMRLNEDFEEEFTFIEIPNSAVVLLRFFLES